ncbi:MAG: transposase [Dokdonella sp.]
MLLKRVSYMEIVLLPSPDDIEIAMLLRMVSPIFPAKGRSRLRLSRSSEPGRIYLITFTTASRRREFADWQVALTATRTLLHPDLWREARLLCWVMMPDHWYGLIELGASESLSAIVRRLKGTTARAVNLANGSSGSVWASEFHDHALRSEEDVVDLARYIVLNPVRAGLVTRIGDYPFWDAIWLTASKSIAAEAAPTDGFAA